VGDKLCVCVYIFMYMFETESAFFLPLTFVTVKIHWRPQAGVLVLLPSLYRLRPEDRSSVTTSKTTVV
jgi:hypothetical protein